MTIIRHEVGAAAGGNVSESAELRADRPPGRWSRWVSDNPALAREWSRRFGAERRSGPVAKAFRWVALFLLVGVYFASAWWFCRGETDPWTARLGVFALGALYLLLITVVVPAQAASSIAWEREQETWQQLLLTRLHPSQLVAAKVLTALWPGICLYLGALPLLLPAMHAARLPLDTALEALAILAATPVAVTTLGVWLSMRFRRRLTSVALAYVATNVTVWLMLISLPPFYVRGENLWWYLSPVWHLGVLCFATTSWAPLARPLLPEWLWFLVLAAGLSALCLAGLQRRIAAETN